MQRALHHRGAEQRERQDRDQRSAPIGACSEHRGRDQHEHRREHTRDPPGPDRRAGTARMPAIRPTRIASGPDREAGAHTVTSGASSVKRLSPMPRTLRSSLTDLKPPRRWRSAMIACA